MRGEKQDSDTVNSGKQMLLSLTGVLLKDAFEQYIFMHAGSSDLSAGNINMHRLLNDLYSDRVNFRICCIYCRKKEIKDGVVSLSLKRANDLNIVVADYCFEEMLESLRDYTGQSGAAAAEALADRGKDVIREFVHKEGTKCFA